MRRQFLMLAFLPAVLAGCAAPGPMQSAALPPDAVVGAGDPTIAAILGAQGAFVNPSSIAGNPAAAAVAIAQLQYLAVEIPTGPRWIEFNPTVGQQLQAGAAEARTAIGVAPSAPPQAVIDTLFAASRALMAGDGAAAATALNTTVYPAGGAATLTRLSALPPLPRAANATSAAANALNEMMSPARGSRGRR